MKEREAQTINTQTHYDSTSKKLDPMKHTIRGRMLGPDGKPATDATVIWVGSRKPSVPYVALPRDDERSRNPPISTLPRALRAGGGTLLQRRRPRGRRALTGYREIDFQQKRDAFDPGDHDSGAKTILGQTGSWGHDDVVRIVCGQPAAATHIARRLYRTFISNTDEPNSELLEALAPLADAIRVKGDVDVARGIEFVLRSRLFHSDECRTKRVRSPAVLAIGAIRGGEAFSPPPDLVELEIHLTRMGQHCSIRRTSRAGRAEWPGCAARPFWRAQLRSLAHRSLLGTEPGTFLRPGRAASAAEHRGLARRNGRAAL